jgi:hypothetical protein
MKFCFVCQKEIQEKDLYYFGGAYPVHKWHDVNIDVSTAKLVEQKPKCQYHRIALVWRPCRRIAQYKIGYPDNSGVTIPLHLCKEHVTKIINENVDKIHVAKTSVLRELLDK